RTLFSVGFTTNNQGVIGDVLWNSPAFKAGLAPGMTLVSVNGLTFSPAVFLHAIADTSQPEHGKLVFVASGSGITDTYTLDYSGGLRYAHIEQIKGTPGYLDQIIAPVKR
ncbi:MAG: peptidase M61, partial [Rhodanobacteraceae bacterium]